MTAAVTRPPLWRRVLRTVPTSRALDISEIGSFGSRMDELEGSSARQRRMWRTDADMVAVHGAVFAAIRRRTRMVTRVGIALVREVAAGEVVEIDQHPALDALHRINDSLTARQGFGLIEQHKLTNGKAYWVKRRNRLGVPVEFEIWPPGDVRIERDPVRTWVPTLFVRRMPSGAEVSVAAADVVWFRHLIDPRDPLNGLSPIGAVRMALDTGLEASRFNQMFYDHGTHISRIFSVEEAGAGESQRIAQQLSREFTGTDRMHRALVLEGGVKPIETQMTFRDMQFLEQHQWTIEEVARVFELSPTSLGDLRHGTFSNTEQGDRSDWDMIVDQVENTLAELTEFFLWPDFGRDLRFVAKLDGIPALQADRKLQAELDAIYLASGKVYINELRQRDGEDEVDWGGAPILPSTMVPLDMHPPAMVPVMAPEPQEAGVERATTAGGGQRSRDADDRELAMRRSWATRLTAEAAAIITHLEAADKRTLELPDVDAYDWDWYLRYGDAAVTELAEAYLDVLQSEGFVSTPLSGAQELAVRYAQGRAGALLRLDGRASVVATTRARVRAMVAETIESGDSLQSLAKRLREDYVFSRQRAMAVANTETQLAIGDGRLQAFQSQGVGGKRWVTAGDLNVCAICAGNAAAGPIALGSPFPSGVAATPGHPGMCRCKIEPVFELPS